MCLGIRIWQQSAAIRAMALNACFVLNAYDARGYIFPPLQLLMPVTKTAPLATRELLWSQICMP